VSGRMSESEAINNESYQVMHFRSTPGQWQAQVLNDVQLSPRTGMRSIVVESRKGARVTPILDALAEGCRQLGHRVHRWRGPLSGRVPYSRRLPACDAAIVFNGLHESYAQSLSTIHSLGMTPIFVEL